jgi:hypothetical protein
MPVASARQEVTVRKELKSLPQGYVVLRRMPYGKWLERRALTKLTINSQKGSKDFKGELALLDKRVTEMEFSQCIVEHNLEISDGVPFDFKVPGSLENLDTRVGEEIGTYINEMHDFESEGNSTGGSEPPSS